MKIKRRINPNVVAVIIVTILSVLLSLHLLDFFDRDFNVFTDYNSDRFSFLALVQSLRESGIKGLYFVDRLGAPEVCSYIDLSSIDPLLLVPLLIINLFTPSAQFTVHVYYILTYVLAALVMYWLLYKLSVRPLVNSICSILFSFTPYHILRGVVHPNLTSIFTIPLGIAIALYIAFNDDDSNKMLSKVFSKKEVIVCACLLGFGCSYYLFFMLMMIALAFIVSAIRSKLNIRQFKTVGKFVTDKLWAPVLSVGCLMIGQAPRFIYGIATGFVNNAMSRSPYETEWFALKPIQLFLPPTYHNSFTLRDITTEYQYNVLIASYDEWPSLGLIASIGIIVLIGLFFVQHIRIGEKVRFDIYSFMASSVVMYMLVACTGGFGEIFNLLVTPQFRCYNRVSVVLAAIGIMAVALFVDKMNVKRQDIWLLLVCSAFVVGLFDQVPLFPEQYNPEEEEEYYMYAEFFAEVEDSLEPGDMVYQLPYIKFPESGSPIEYEHFKGFMFTKTIRWSYGAVGGRDFMYENLNIDEGLSREFIDSLIANGFAGIYIDTTGYEDEGETILGFYSTLGYEPIISGNGELYFYNICDNIIR